MRIGVMYMFMCWLAGILRGNGGSFFNMKECTHAAYLVSFLQMNSQQERGTAGENENTVPPTMNGQEQVTAGETTVPSTHVVQEIAITGFVTNVEGSAVATVSVGNSPGSAGEDNFVDPKINDSRPTNTQFPYFGVLRVTNLPGTPRRCTFDSFVVKFPNKEVYNLSQKEFMYHILLIIKERKERKEKQWIKNECQKRKEKKQKTEKKRE